MSADVAHPAQEPATARPAPRVPEGPSQPELARAPGAPIALLSLPDLAAAQQLAGNQAVQRLVATAGPAVQRETDAQRTARLRASWTQQTTSLDYRQAAVTLNAFSKDDMPGLLAPLSHDALVQIDLAARRFMLGFNDRVIAAVKDKDAEADRVAGVFASWYDAVSRQQYAEAVTALDGCSNADLRRLLREAAGRADAKDLFQGMKKAVGDHSRIYDELALWLESADTAGLGGAHGLTTELTLDDAEIAAEVKKTVPDPNVLSTPQLLGLKSIGAKGLTGAWSKLDWGEMRRQLVARILKPELVTQNQLNTCNSAAVVAGMARSDPVGYAHAAVFVWLNGHAAGGNVVAALTSNSNVDKEGEIAPQVDWMMISAMQNAENAMLDFDGSRASFLQVSSGGFDYNEKAGLDSAGAKQKKVYNGNEASIPIVGDLLSKYGHRLIVVLNCHANKLASDPASDNESASTYLGMAGDMHAVTLTQLASLGDKVAFSLNTWGDIHAHTWTKAHWVEFTSDYVVGARDNDVKLP